MAYAVPASTANDRERGFSGSSLGPGQSASVTFNGVAANSSIWTNTSIIVPVPSVATSGNVVVTVAALPSNGQHFTVVPAIASISPTVGQVGSIVTVTGTSFGSTPGTVTFNGIPGSPAEQEFEIAYSQTLHPPAKTTFDGAWTYKSAHEATGMIKADECVEPKDKGTRKGFLWHSLCGLQDDVNEFGSGMLIIAEETQAQNEFRARFAWWISSALYALGRGLGLVGKVYGVPEATGGD